jgi:hypothetical protein
MLTINQSGTLQTLIATKVSLKYLPENIPSERKNIIPTIINIA